jgi:hypothetical protein
MIFYLDDRNRYSFETLIPIQILGKGSRDLIFIGKFYWNYKVREMLMSVGGVTKLSGCDVVPFNV